MTATPTPAEIVLKPCPFCGCKVQMTASDGKQIICMGVNCGAYLEGHTAEVASRKWNTRIPDLTTLQAENAALTKERAALRAGLRWLRAFWMPGSNHDTAEVQNALANADALLSQEQPR